MLCCCLWPQKRGWKGYRIALPLFLKFGWPGDRVLSHERSVGKAFTFLIKQRRPWCLLPSLLLTPASNADVMTRAAALQPWVSFREVNMVEMVKGKVKGAWIVGDPVGPPQHFQKATSTCLVKWEKQLPSISWVPATSRWKHPNWYRPAVVKGKRAYPGLCFGKWEPHKHFRWYLLVKDKINNMLSFYLWSFSLSLQASHSSRLYITFPICFQHFFNCLLLVIFRKCLWSNQNIMHIEVFLKRNKRSVALFGEMNVVDSTMRVSLKLGLRVPLSKAKAGVPGWSPSQSLSQASLEGWYLQLLSRASFPELGILVSFTRWEVLETSAENDLRPQSPTFIIIHDSVWRETMKTWSMSGATEALVSHFQKGELQLPPRGIHKHQSSCK